MQAAVDFEVDSNCFAPPLEADGPTAEICKDDASTYVITRRGHRKYICPSHAAEVDRFDDVDTEDHPRVSVCEACMRLTPVVKVDHEGRCVDCQIDP